MVRRQDRLDLEDFEWQHYVKAGCRDLEHSAAGPRYAIKDNLDEQAFKHAFRRLHRHGVRRVRALFIKSYLAVMLYVVCILAIVAIPFVAMASSGVTFLWCAFTGVLLFVILAWCGRKLLRTPIGYIAYQFGLNI